MRHIPFERIHTAHTACSVFIFSGCQEASETNARSILELRQLFDGYTREFADEVSDQIVAYHYTPSESRTSTPTSGLIIDTGSIPIRVSSFYEYTTSFRYYCEINGQTFLTSRGTPTNIMQAQFSVEIPKAPAEDSPEYFLDGFVEISEGRTSASMKFSSDLSDDTHSTWNIKTISLTDDGKQLYVSQYYK